MNIVPPPHPHPPHHAHVDVAQLAQLTQLEDIVPPVKFRFPHTSIIIIPPPLHPAHHVPPAQFAPHPPHPPAQHAMNTFLFDSVVGNLNAVGPVFVPLAGPDHPFPGGVILFIKSMYFQIVPFPPAVFIAAAHDPPAHHCQFI